MLEQEEPKRLDDPFRPGYRPSYEGPDPELGKVGSAAGFGVSLYHMYRAGRTRLPELAEQYAALTGMVHDIGYASHSLFRVNGEIDQPAHRVWLDLRDELQRVFLRPALNFYATGRALVEIADRYARTDEEATEEFSRRLGTNAEDFAEPPAPEPYMRNRTIIRPRTSPPAPAGSTPEPAAREERDADAGHDGNELSVAERTTRFNQVELDVAVADIGRYLTELKYIDSALTYMESVHQLQSAGPAPAYHTHLRLAWGTPIRSPRRSASTALHSTWQRWRLRWRRASRSPTALSPTRWTC